MEEAHMRCSQITLPGDSFHASVFSLSLLFWWGDTEADLQGPRGKGGGTTKPRFRTRMLARWWREEECHRKSLARGWSLPGSSWCTGHWTAAAVPYSWAMPRDPLQLGLMESRCCAVWGKPSWSVPWGTQTDTLSFILLSQKQIREGKLQPGNPAREFTATGWNPIV